MDPSKMFCFQPLIFLLQKECKSRATLVTAWPRFSLKDDLLVEDPQNLLSISILADDVQTLQVFLQYLDRSGRSLPDALKHTTTNGNTLQLSMQLHSRRTFDFLSTHYPHFLRNGRLWDFKLSILLGCKGSILCQRLTANRRRRKQRNSPRIHCVRNSRFGREFRICIQFGPRSKLGSPYRS